MQAIIDAFEKTHPSKEVVHTQFVNTNDGNLKLDITLEGGNHIDVFFTYSVKSLAQRSSSGIMPDLSKRLRADKRLVGYLDAAVPKSFRVAGKVGALAASRSPLITIVNDALRDNASFDLPQEWDLAELRLISKKMSKFVAVSGGLAISDIARIAPGPNHQYTKSGNSNFSDPPFENWLPTGHEMIRTGESYPWTEVLSRHLPVYQKNRFLSQDFGFWTSQPFVLRYLNDSVSFPHDFTVSFALLPRVQSGRFWKIDSCGDFMAVSEKSKRQDLVWESLSFWIVEGARLMLCAGRLPSLDVLVDDHTIVSGMLAKDAEKYVDPDSFRGLAVEKPPRLVIDSNLTAHNEIAAVGVKVYPFAEPWIIRSPRYPLSARYVRGTLPVSYAPVLCRAAHRIRRRDEGRRGKRMGDFSSKLFPDGRPVLIALGILSILPISVTVLVLQKRFVQAMSSSGRKWLSRPKENQ